jgi:D-proline reductase (dithiol) PrdB
VGLVQRAIEAAGVPTVSVSMLRPMTRKIGVPRAIGVDFPLGHPFGFPGQSSRQRRILSGMARLAAEAVFPGTIVDLGSDV